MKIKVTQLQRNNALEALYIMMPTIPPEDIAPNLVYWRKKSFIGGVGCGTPACFGGFCAVYPLFYEQGVREYINGMPTDTRQIKQGDDIAEMLFGCDSMFNLRGYCGFDYISVKQSDHALICNRLEQLIKESVVV